MMRLILATFLCITAGLAQDKTNSTPDENPIAPLQVLTDQVKHALAAGDLALAGQLAKELGDGILRREKDVRRAEIEAELPWSGPRRFYALTRVAHAAYEASEYEKAEAYADELISLAQEYKEDPYYGDAIHLGNLITGRVALRRDKNLVKAKAALLASGRTPGSPGLRSFGPNMSLAQDLLSAGERDIVLQYFGECVAFWKNRRSRLDDWSAAVRSCCRMPEFGANLEYDLFSSEGYASSGQ